MSPKPSPSITPRTNACFETNWKPSLISRKVSVQSMRLSLERSRRGIGREYTIAADTRKVMASKISARASWSTLNAEMMSSSPSTVASPASNEKMIDAIGNVP